MTQKKRKTVAVMVGNCHSDHPQRLIDHLVEKFKTTEVELRIYIGTESASFLTPGVNNASFDYQYLSLYGYSEFLRPDLMILSYGTVSTYHPDMTLEGFLNRLPDVPVLVLEYDQPVSNGCYLISDNSGGIQSCVRHLYEKGRRSFGFVSGPKHNRDAALRRQGFETAMEELGLPHGEDRIVYGDFSSYVEDRVEELLRRHPELDAIVSANDEMCRSIYKVLERHGKTIGKEVAVTGYDDILLGRYMSPPLTTAKQDVERMADRAFEKAMGLLGGKEETDEMIPSPFICRSSCGSVYHTSQETFRSKSKLELAMEIRLLQQEQYRTWSGALLLRGLVAATDSDHSFFRVLGEQLWELGIPESRIFLLERPVRVKQGEIMEMPKQLRMVLFQEEERVLSFDRTEAPAWGREQGYPVLTERKRAGQYLTFLLSFEDTQYGILELPAESDKIAFYYMLSLEIGTAIRYLEQSYLMQKTQREIVAKNMELHYAASHDKLTGLYNREGGMQQFQRLIRRYPTIRYVAVMADLDHLKQINDRYGHGAGDEALRAASALLQEAIGQESPLSRNGGDEFIGICEESRHSAMELRLRIKQVCRRFNENSGLPFFVDISVGTCSFAGVEFSSIEDILRKADQELYLDKENRKENVCDRKLERYS